MYRKFVFEKSQCREKAEIKRSGSFSYKHLLYPLVKTDYLRMAEKVPTAIGQVIEGKIMSFRICHECHDVSNNCFIFMCNKIHIVACSKVSESTESFFDISLPMLVKFFYKVYCFVTT